MSKVQNDSSSAPSDGPSNAPSFAAKLLSHLKGNHDAFEEKRHLILKEALGLAAFDGWTPLMLQRACKNAAISTHDSQIAFPNNIIDVLDFWAQENDISMLKEMAKPDFQSYKIREKVTKAIQARLDILTPHHEAARRAAATLAMPLYVGKGPKFIWRTSDLIWRGLGDTSTDFNYYSKRTTLCGVWTTTFSHWLTDESNDYEDTQKFLADRIENVMGIEKLKANMRNKNFNPAALITESLIPTLAKMRYKNYP